MKRNNLSDSIADILTDADIGGENLPDPASFTSNDFTKSAFGRNTSSMYSLEPGHVCPHCHYGTLEEDISFNGTPCEFFVYCPVCNAHICTYKPMPHQEAF